MNCNDPSLAEDEQTGRHSGRFDDRYAFTSKDTRAEYRFIYVLAAAARAPAESEPSLAGQCRELAEAIWEKERSMNRSDYSYIPGGVFSGVNIVEPDYPELLEDHPFIWQQSEYIIHGATPFLFISLAFDQLLNEAKEE